MRKIKSAIAIAVILIALSLAGCTKVWSYRFFFYDNMLANWDFYTPFEGDCSYGCGPDGMIINNVFAQAKHAYSYRFKMSIEFDLSSDSSHVVDSFNIYFLDSELLESTSFFALGFGNIGIGEDEYFVLLEDTISTEPRVMASGDALPASMLVYGRNVLDVERIGQVIRCYMNGVMFAEGELDRYLLGLVVPMLEVNQVMRDYDRQLKIRRFRIEYDGSRRRLPLFTPSPDASSEGYDAQLHNLEAMQH